jgi:hypothetical protein
MAILTRFRRSVPRAAFALMLAVGAVRAATPARIVSTQQVYAAFTLNLTQFVSWPETAFRDEAAPLVIGTFPRDPVNAHLDAAVRQETAGGRPIRTLRLETLDDVARCHVVFLSKSNPRQAAALERAAGRPILTISDADGFLERGGHVRFVPDPPRTRLRIAIGNLKRSGLTGRSQLLRFAVQ